MGHESINWHSLFFLLFALLACGMALAVVFTNNVVRMAVYLIFSLSATSGLMFLAGADFVGAMQLMIYVGGTLVLLIFGVMLTAQGPFINMRSGGGEWAVAFIVGSSLLAVLVTTAISVPQWLPAPAVAEHPAPAETPVEDEHPKVTRTVALADEAPAEEAPKSETPAETPAAEKQPETPEEKQPQAITGGPTEDMRTATPIGMALLGARVDKPNVTGASGYLLPFEIISVHLLVVLIGAAYLARAKKRVG